MKKLMKDKKGFTLVEILVVLAILAILIAIAVPTMIGALNDAKEKASLADARTAYIAYELKASTSDVKISDIRDYMDKSGNTDIQCAVKTTTVDNVEKVTEFYYTDANLTKRGKYIQIKLGDKATIVEGTLDKIQGATQLS